MAIHKGGCHCGRITFEVEASADMDLHDCNCSICRMTGYEHLIVPSSAFTLTKGKQDLTCYTFNTGTAKHYFCSHCGIKSFYVPRSNPDGYSVNARCLEPGTIKSKTIVGFDGQNWEANANSVRQLSQE
jgi:hypothetical protein